MPVSTNTVDSRGTIFKMKVIVAVETKSSFNNLEGNPDVSQIEPWSIWTFVREFVRYNVPEAAAGSQTHPGLATRIGCPSGEPKILERLRNRVFPKKAR